MTEAFARMLPDGRRLHLQAGPIDLVIEADGKPDAVQQALVSAADAFQPILPDLVSELVMLRTPLVDGQLSPKGSVAKRMFDAAMKFAQHDVSPMIAVAGSVADFILQEMLAGNDLDRVYVNNGGDIALWLGEGQTFDIGIVSRFDAPEIDMTAQVSFADGIGGVATSGWRGRSFSLGVADAVTVLAPTAALADAAATLIANECDPGPCPQVQRTAARDLDPDSDLGDRQVTTDVAPLSDRQVRTALDQAEELAQEFVDAGLITAASVSLQGDVRVAGEIRQQEIHKIERHQNHGEDQYAVG